MIASRRSFLAAAALAPLALAGKASAEPAVCYDPNALPLSQRSRRRALGYVDASPDPAKQCGRCSFFTAAAPGCGTCTMLSGGAVNGGSVCNSFARKSAT
ncbi:high-potential iron-sulfur protein [Novosphingobium sp. G106]|uniref:high-potential iron-sulfur protein n=1 Tax=Novosphingobium sp. G106 TaxID=2849500 RepID=UPI001C2D3068|nr:high-potential iron-sulfur protein [Novosphingobium sp. G106]MBV1686720.1 high-potential iron-sulfur protein [Novosphingobium sp. G106]